jgi:hypothetical protein
VLTDLKSAAVSEDGRRMLAAPVLRFGSFMRIRGRADRLQELIALRPTFARVRTFIAKQPHTVLDVICLGVRHWKRGNKSSGVDHD